MYWLTVLLKKFYHWFQYNLKCKLIQFGTSLWPFPLCPMRMSWHLHILDTEHNKILSLDECKHYTWGKFIRLAKTRTYLKFAYSWDLKWLSIESAKLNVVNLPVNPVWYCKQPSGCLEKICSYRENIYTLLLRVKLPVAWSTRNLGDLDFPHSVCSSSSEGKTQHCCVWALTTNLSINYKHIIKFKTTSKNEMIYLPCWPEFCPHIVGKFWLVLVCNEMILSQLSQPDKSLPD